MEPARTKATIDVTERTVRGLLRRTRQAVFLTSFLGASSIGFLVLGIACLALRATHVLEPNPELALLLPVGVALGVASVVDHRRRMSREAAATWIDVATGGHGLVVAATEASDPRWQSAVDQTLEGKRTLPAFQFQGQLWRTLAACLFLAAALWIRIPEPKPGPSPELMEAAVALLGDKLGILQENVSLDEELAEDLGGRLGRLQELLENEDVSPESLFEAMDSLEDRLGIEGERLRRELESASRDLVDVVMDGNRDPASAMEALQRALATLREAGVDQNLPGSLDELLGAGLELPEGLNLSPAEMMKLAGSLSKLMQGNLGELAGVGLIDPSKLALAAKFADLTDFLPTDHECDEDCEGGT